MGYVLPKPDNCQTVLRISFSGSQPEPGVQGASGFKKGIIGVHHRRDEKMMILIFYVK